MDKPQEKKNIPYDGQPFRLGMLYDCRNSCVVPGIFINGEESEALPLSETDSKPTLDLQTEKKQIHFDVTASVKFSFLFFSKTLSAKYLFDHTASVNTVQVTIKYKRMSFEKRFFPSEEITSPAQKMALEGDVATHVVTSIKYGCEVDFTFEKEVKDGQTKQDVKGPMVKYLKSAASGMKLDEKGETNKNKSDGNKDALGNDCKVHITGDLNFSDGNEHKPSTLEEAMQFCQKIPELLGNKAFPKEISLSPLHTFAFKNTKISQLGMSFSAKINDELQGVVLQLTGIVRQAHDIAIRASQFQRINLQLQEFITAVSNFCISFQEEISKVRNADEDEKGSCMHSEALHSVYRKYLSSPFAYTHLKLWLDLKEKEIVVLEKCLQFLKSQSIKMAFKTGEMENLTHSFEYEHVVSLEFTMIGATGTEFLTNLEAHLANSDREMPKTVAHNQWFLEPSMKIKVLQFVRLVRTTLNKQNFCFAITDRTGRANDNDDCLTADDSKDSVVILKYTDTIPSKYEIPSCPSKPSSLSTSMTSIEITWNEPDKHASEIKQYQISYWQHELKGKRYTVKTIGRQTKIAISNLESNTGYCFAVSGICYPGTTDQSEVSDVIHTEGSALARSLIKNSNSRMSNGQRTCFEVPISEPILNKVFKIAQCVIGTSAKQTSGGNNDKERTILLTGMSVSLIREAANAIFNSIMSISCKEKLYFKLTSPLSNTSDETSSDWITIYQIHQQENFPISLSMIEFPHFGVYREKNYAQLEACFTKFGITHLNTIIIISEECSCPITLSQKYSLWSFLSMFSHDLKYSIVSLSSAAISEDLVSDQAKEIQADYLIQANIQPTKVFQFYPSAILAKNDEASLQHWNMNDQVMKSLLTFIAGSTSLSTERTVQILQTEQKLSEVVLKLSFQRKLCSEQEIKEIIDKRKFLAEYSLKPNPLYDVTILDELIDKDLLGHREYLTLKRVQAKEIQDITL